MLKLLCMIRKVKRSLLLRFPSCDNLGSEQGSKVIGMIEIESSDLQNLDIYGEDDIRGQHSTYGNKIKRQVEKQQKEAGKKDDFILAEPGV